MAKRAKNDFYAERAKAMGYPARSVFKLEEILQKNPFIMAGHKVLDLGAAPGSWSLYLARKLNVNVVAVDLKALEVQHENIKAIKGDMLSSAVAEKLVVEAPFDSVVCDAAPATTGDRLVDCSRSQELATYALEIALQYLTKGGHFVVKVFQNGDEQVLLNQIKKHFKVVKVFKPKAVRSESFEIYFIGNQFIKSSTQEKTGSLSA